MSDELIQTINGASPGPSQDQKPDPTPSDSAGGEPAEERPEEPANTSERVPPGPVRFTLFRAKHALTKTLTLLPDGRVYRDATGCALARGTFKTMTVSGLERFAEVLTNAKHMECLAYGVCTRAECGAVVSMAKAKVGDITRTKDNWEYTAGAPAILMLDYDAPANAPAVDMNAWLGRLYEACPALESTERLWRPSTSSLIYLNGIELRAGNDSTSPWPTARIFRAPGKRCSSACG